MVTVLVRRVLPVIGLGALFALAARRALLPHTGGDMWLHLRLGDEFLKGWSIRHPGHLGPFDTASWTSTQWLSQIGMAWTEQVLGLGGVLWLSAAVNVALLAVLYLTCRSAAGPLPAMLAVVVALASLAPALTARPQVLSYLFVALTAWAWTATARDGRIRYWLVLVTWAWVPLHGMWPIGVGLSAVLAAGVALDRRSRGRELVGLISVPVLSAMVTMVTPLGTKALHAVLVVGERSQYFAEWAPADFTNPTTGGVSVMAGVVLVSMLRQGTTRWFQIFLLGSGIGCAVLSIRTVPAAAVMLAPLFAQAIQAVVPSSGRVNRRELASVVVMAAAVLAVLAAVAPERAARDVAPRWLTQRLDASPPGTRVLNDWDTGAYFLWRHPHVSLVMHGYGDVFTDAELARNAGIMRLGPGWDDALAELSVDLALVDPDSALAYALIEQDGWAVVDGDNDFKLLRPPPS